MENENFGTYSLKFDGAVDPFGHQVLRAKPMDIYNSVLGSN